MRFADRARDYSRTANVGDTIRVKRPYIRDEEFVLDEYGERTYYYVDGIVTERKNNWMYVLTVTNDSRIEDDGIKDSLVGWIVTAPFYIYVGGDVNDRVINLTGQGYYTMAEVIVDFKELLNGILYAIAGLLLCAFIFQSVKDWRNKK